MYETTLKHVIITAIDRLYTDMQQAAPFMTEQVWPWIRQLSGTAPPQNYFTHPLAFPSLLLPWQLEQTLHPAPDLAWQTDLVYSTINGYYFIRLVDNLMDGNATVEVKLLPALSFFHSRFQAVYHHHFPADHPFWDIFNAAWVQCAEATMRDALLRDIDEPQFWQISARKVSAIKIPLAAVGYRYNATPRLEPWLQFVDRLGGWHQFLNDLLGWYQDHRRGTCTYFLSEANRRRQEDETAVEWVIREGFDWAVDRLRQWMSNLKTEASRLDSPALLDYLDRRVTMFEQQANDAARGLHELGKIIRKKKKPARSQSGERGKDDVIFGRR